MRYCYNCNRITRGEPIFCSFCGRTYNQKFCSRMHPNPRRAQFCNQCGSAEFSTPQPVIPILLRPAFWLLKLSPRLVIPTTLVILIAYTLHLIVTDPYVQCRFIVLVLVLGLCWYIWRKLPDVVRNGSAMVFRWLFRSNRNRGR
jgi:hypothetical protein